MAVSASQPLSANDARILHAIFDPETLPSSVAKSKDAAAIDAALPAHPTISASKLAELEQQQNELVRRINSADQDPKNKSEERESTSTLSEIENVLKELDDVVKQEPEYGSAYLNRAMAHRIHLEHRIPSTNSSSDPAPSIFTLPHELLAPLFADLTSAITCSLPSPSSSPASEYQARILRTAHSHRAYLYLKAAESGSWQGKGKSELEELASRDFSLAARYGDEKAREMSVRTNPYSKMCGAIVREALSEERREAGMRGL